MECAVLFVRYQARETAVDQDAQIREEHARGVGAQYGEIQHATFRATIQHLCRL